MSKFSTNPFDRTVLQNDKLLSGKTHLRILKNIRKELKYQSNNKYCRSFIIKGERGTGKSSLLKILSNEAANSNFVPVSIYLTENNSSEISFFQSLYNGLFNVCKEHEILIDEISKAEISVAKTEIIEDSRLWVFEFINKLIEYKISNRSASNLISDDVLKDFKLIISNIRESSKFNSNTKIAILIDESQNIFNNSGLLGILRHILQENIGITFFFAVQNQITDSKAIDVFDNLNRNFLVYNLDYFDDINDVKDFFDKSFESIGWKDADIRLNVNNYNSLVKSIYLLTSGKPEFINRIADSMFRKVIEREDNKLRLNENLLNEITNDLEKSVSFSLIRAEKVLKLRQFEFEWFNLFCGSQFSKPKDIYDYFSIFFDDFNEINKFSNLVHHWAKDGIIEFIREKKEGEKFIFKTIDFSKEELSHEELIKLPFVYPGSAIEREWLIIKMSQAGKSLLFNSRRLTDIMMSKIARIAGLNGTPNIYDSSSKNKVFNSNFYINGDANENSFLELFDAAKNRSLKLPNDSIYSKVNYLFDFLNSKGLITYTQFFYLSIKINNDYKNFFSYRFERRSKEEMTSIYDNLDKLSSRFLIEKEIDMKYEFEDLIQEQICSYHDFEVAILNSDNEEAKLSLLSNSCQKAVDLYLHNRDSNIDQIAKWNEVIFVGIKNNLNVEHHVVNNAGYLFMNINEYAKAKTCFEYVISQKENSEIDLLTDHGYYSSLFLSTYNSGILKVHDKKYIEAISLFKDCESIYYSIRKPDWTASALNYLITEDNSIVVNEELNSKNIDVLQLVESNLELLSNFNILIEDSNS
jgi:hypothetical protein